MIKTLDLFVAKNGMDRDAFTKAWADTHAPKAAGLPGLKGYILSHIVEEPGRPDIPQLAMPQIAGVQEMWFDSLEARQEALVKPEWRDWFAERAGFASAMKTFLVKEDVIVPVPTPRPAAKNYAFLNKNPEFDDAKFRYEWHVGHGPMGKNVPYVRGFVPCDMVAELGQSDVPTFAADVIEGVAQAYFDSAEEELMMLKTPEAQEWFKHGSETFGLIKPFGMVETVIITPEG